MSVRPIPEIQSSSRRGIAVIGMHVNAPGAPDLDAFWRVIREGREAIQFFSDEELDAAGAPPKLRATPGYVAAGAVLPDIDMFDAAFFDVNPADATVMDPQLRRFLEAAWSVFEVAGYDPRRLTTPVGVYAGSASSSYLLSNLRSILKGKDASMGAQLLNERDSLATLTSYKLDLKGPSLSVQTNCSTSLVAVHLACQGLNLGECDMALAGGVAINVHQAKGYVHEKGMFSSPDGHTRPFDAGANGMLFGSGLGLVLLKRLDDAIRDGDQIHAVITGSALSNDGGVKASFTAPNVAGQVKAIMNALTAAEATAESIGYIETHGTGTPLGDSIEIEALTRVFRSQTAKRAFCCLGSAKANFGHTDRAAGILGFIKTCLVVRHGELPPLVNFRTPNPHLRLGSSPFYVRTDAGEWHSHDGPRRAGVSAFGGGGTNAHVIVEEGPPRVPSASARTAQLLTWSARSPAALEARTERLAAVLEEDADLQLTDVAYTEHTGRTAFPFRRILVSESSVEGVAAMRRRDPERLISGKVREVSGSPEVVFIFPGVGVPFPGALRDVYESEPVFRSNINHAQALLEKTMTIDLIGLLTLPGPQEKQIASTFGEVASDMAAPFAIEYALARQLMYWGIQPAAMIGHGLGEYVAACLAGVFSFEDALQLISIRKKLLVSTPPGGMIAVSCAVPEIQASLSGDVYLGAINSPKQCLISGSLDALGALEVQLGKRGVEFYRTALRIAAHSPLMQAVAPDLTRAVTALTLHPPAIPFVCGATGTWVTAEDAVRPAYWAEQLTRTVRFAQGISTVSERKSTLLLEVSARASLVGLVKESLPMEEHSRAFALMSGSNQDRNAEHLLLQGLGKLWINGVNVDWINFHQQDKLHRVSLPPYPFERTRYWVDDNVQAAGQRTDEVSTAMSSNIADWFYLPSWRQTLPISKRPMDGKYASGTSCVLLLAEEDAKVPRQLAQELSTAGVHVILVSPGNCFEASECGAYRGRPTSDEDYVALFDALKQRGLTPFRIVHCLSLTMPGATNTATFEQGHALGLYSLLSLVRTVIRNADLVRAEISVVSSNIHAIGTGDVVRPERSVFAAVCRVVSQEYPTLFCRSLEIDDEGAFDSETSVSAGHLAAEIFSGKEESVVAYRGARRWVRAFEAIHLEKKDTQACPWRGDGVYLVTGGLGKVGLSIAEHILHSADAATVVLLGRTSPSKEAVLRRLHSGGSRLIAMQGDTSDPTRMAEVVTEIRTRFGALHGVVHAAGNVEFDGARPVDETGGDTLATHFRPKVHALYVLEQVLADVEEVEFCLLISSLSAHLGGLGNVAYAAANAFMDAFARARIRVSRPRWISVDSGVWSFEEESKQRRVQVGMELSSSIASFQMSGEDANEALDRVLLSGASEIALSTGDLNQRYRKWAIGEATAPSATSPTSATHSRDDLQSTYVAPRSGTEKKIAEVWAQVLGYSKVGVDDNFFRLGGDSISAIRIVARLRDTFDLDVSVTDLLRDPTIARLSAAIPDPALSVIHRTSSVSRQINLSPNGVQLTAD